MELIVLHLIPLLFLLCLFYNCYVLTGINIFIYIYVLIYIYVCIYINIYIYKYIYIYVYNIFRKIETCKFPSINISYITKLESILKSNNPSDNSFYLNVHSIEFNGNSCNTSMSGSRSSSSSGSSGSFELRGVEDDTCTNSKSGSTDCRNINCFKSSSSSSSSNNSGFELMRNQVELMGGVQDEVFYELKNNQNYYEDAMKLKYAHVTNNHHATDSTFHSYAQQANGTGQGSCTSSRGIL